MKISILKLEIANTLQYLTRIINQKTPFKQTQAANLKNPQIQGSNELTCNKKKTQSKQHVFVTQQPHDL